MANDTRRYKVNQCERRWFNLEKVEGETEKRFCRHCDKNVHWCNTEQELIHAVENNWCIATENKLAYTGEKITEINDKTEISPIFTDEPPIMLGDVVIAYDPSGRENSKP